MQPRYFVLVLVGHQLEQVAGHGFGQRGAWRGIPQQRFGRAHLLDKGFVLRRICRVLVAGKEVHAGLDHLVQARLLDELNHLLGFEQSLHRGQVVRATPAPFKRGLVVGHLHTVQLHRTHQRGVAQWHTALLPGVAQHQRVGVDAVAQQLLGHHLGVKRTHQCVAHAGTHGSFAVAAWKLPVGVADEGRGGRAVRVQRHVGAALLHHAQGVLGGAHNAVAGNHQVGLGGVHLGRKDGLGPVGNLDVAPGGAALLRQAASVLRDHALAFQVRGHAQQRTDGDDTRAAHTTDHDAPGLFTQRQRRFR